MDQFIWATPCPQNPAQSSLPWATKDIKNVSSQNNADQNFEKFANIFSLSQVPGELKACKILGEHFVRKEIKILSYSKRQISKLVLKAHIW